MSKENSEMTRKFHVVTDFFRFHHGEEVSAVLYADCFAVEAGTRQLKVPYGEIQYVAHCERQDARASGLLDLVPFAFGMGSTGAFAAETAASFGIDAAERGAAPKDFYKNLCIVGYYDGGKQEDWVILQDEHTFETNAFVQELAKRANTKVIHYLSGLERKAEE